MGLGPNGTSLLNKLGFKQAWEMDDDELQALVAKDQRRRTDERNFGRATKAVIEDEGDGKYQLKVGRPRTKSRVKKVPQAPAAGDRLEAFGIKPELCEKLRASGKPDWQLILELQGAGII